MSVVCLAVPAPAPADPSEALRDGQNALTSLDYARAIVSFDRAVADPQATVIQRAQAYAWLVRCHVVLGHDREARAAAVRLLEIDPGARIAGPNVPPRVTRFFDEVRRVTRPAARVVIAADLGHRRIAPGATLPITAWVSEGDDAVSRLVIKIRFGQELAYASTELERQGRQWGAGVDVPADFRPLVDPVRYYVEAYSITGGLIGKLGSPEEPLVVPPSPDLPPEEPPPPDRSAEDALDRSLSQHGDGAAEHDGPAATGRPITSRWWFWTGIVVVVAGGTVAAIVLTDKAEPARHGRHGDVALP